MARQRSPAAPVVSSDFFHTKPDPDFIRDRNTADETMTTKNAARRVVRRYRVSIPKTSSDSSYVTPGKYPMIGLNAKICGDPNETTAMRARTKLPTSQN